MSNAAQRIQLILAGWDGKTPIAGTIATGPISQGIAAIAAEIDKMRAERDENQRIIDQVWAERDEARADEAEAMRLTNSWKAEAERLRAKLSECKAEVLHDLMSDISELHWAATWQSGLEYALWNAVSDPSAERRVWGGIQLGEDEIAQMKALSEEICGWSQYGEFVPMDKWLEMVKAREARK